MEEAIMVSKADIFKAAIAVDSALNFMAKKAGVSPITILETITLDPTGNTARYFKDLTSSININEL